MEIETNKIFLQSELSRSSTEFRSLVSNLSKEDFEKNSNGKWSAGQDLQHVIKTLRIIRIGISIPRTFLRIIFGTASRPSRLYRDFEARYREKIQQGFKAPAYVQPTKVELSQRDQLLKTLDHQTEKFCDKINNLTENELDRHILPHPLFGKITMREMVMATWLHQDHHIRQLKSKLEKNNQENLV